MEKILADKKNLTRIPLSPGVYLFRDTNDDVIYVGKAKQLRNRLKSYWATSLLDKTKQMMTEAISVSFIQVSSEFEALLLESALVKKHRPKYNIELKDDKSPLYIGITKERYPRILAFRQTQLSSKELKAVYGPYLNGRSVRSLLKKLRRIISFSTHRPTKRACIYEEIGLCYPCPSVIENTLDDKSKAKLRRKYLRNINKIQKLLEGEVDNVKKILLNEIDNYSKDEDFELAQQSLRSLEALNYMTEPKNEVREYMENPNFIQDIRDKELNQLISLLSKHINISKLKRIECFDIAHIAGSYPTASMVTFIDGEPDKTYYRHFRIREEKKNNDVDSMKSILERRIKHVNDWGKPDLIVVDGGKGQVSAALEVLSNDFPVIGLAKRYETVVIKKGDEFIEIRPKGPALSLLQRMRDEAHRFARRYHHKLVSQAIKTSGNIKS